MLYANDFSILGLWLISLQSAFHVFQKLFKTKYISLHLFLKQNLHFKFILNVKTINMPKIQICNYVLFFESCYFKWFQNHQKFRIQTLCWSFMFNLIFQILVMKALTTNTSDFYSVVLGHRLATRSYCAQ